MKHLRKASLVIVLTIIATGLMAQAGKFGHVHSTFVMTKMPEYIQAMKTLTALDSTYALELERLSVEITVFPLAEPSKTHLVLAEKLSS